MLELFNVVCGVLVGVSLSPFQSSSSLQGQVHRVRYKICTFVNGKKKLFAPKLDNLLKHEGHCKAKVLMLGVDAKANVFQQRFCTCKE